MRHTGVSPVCFFFFFFALLLRLFAILYVAWDTAAFGCGTAEGGCAT